LRPGLASAWYGFFPSNPRILLRALAILLAEQSIEPEVSHFATDPQVQHVRLGTA